MDPSLKLMLASLIVRDIVLIEKAELAFAPGLNVLTGETGAGKSILLDALGLAGEHIQAGRKCELGFFDENDVADDERGQHEL